MSDEPDGKPVPSGRLSRVIGLGSLAGRIAGNMVTSGAGQLLKGQRPAMADLLLTPANITRIADKLATMRGAAMKVGQLISMDGGDFLPEELSAILARLREDASPMPKVQLTEVLSNALGENWLDNMLYFSFAPVAAASIGQVHKAITPDGTMLALKVQYPGVRESIDSDVDNVATLVRMSGLIPKTLDIAPVLEEAKQQLKQEADYLREAYMLDTYRSRLQDDDAFIVPRSYPSLCTENVLAMSFEKGDDIESVLQLEQDLRNGIMSALMRLFFREVFDFKLIQSDPNLANYRYDPVSGKIILLDFGATREIAPAMAEGYRSLLRAAANNDADAMLSAALSIGLVTSEHTTQQQTKVVELGMTACEAIHVDGSYDFGNSDLIMRLHNMGTALTYRENFWHVPPADALFIHRKLGGLFLLARRLKVQMNLRQIASPWIQ